MRKFGEYATRKSFSKVKEVLEVKDLLDVQKESYQRFLEEGIQDVFDDIFPIESFTGNMSLEFSDYVIEEPNYTIRRAIDRNLTYSAPLRVKARLFLHETGEVKEQEIFLGDLPIMTDKGSFIISGIERVVQSQLVRSPSIYFKREIDRNGRPVVMGEVIPSKGAWLEYEIDARDTAYVRIDRMRKIPLTTLLRALGLSSDDDIISMYGDNMYIQNTLAKDTTTNTDEALIEVFEKLRPGEPATLDSAKNQISTKFFDVFRYDLAKVGRYKHNKKLFILERALGLTLAKDIKDGKKVLVKKGEVLTKEKIDMLRPYFMDGLNLVKVNINDDIETFNEVQEIYVYDKEDKEKVIRLIGNNPKVEERFITTPDIYASINYYFNLLQNIGNLDEVDHLGNRRVRQVGELVENQFKIGLMRMDKNIRERMTTQDLDEITPRKLINIRPLTAVVKEFFGSSQLSNFMEQINPLSELTAKRRLTSLGPGGLMRDRAGMVVRDVNVTHYGRICPIESPEGPNIGLITSLALYAKINEYGFVTTPYQKVENKKLTDEIVYLTADEEANYNISQATIEIKDGKIIEEEVVARANGLDIMVKSEDVDFLDVAPEQIISVSTGCIPFLAHDDTSRALMGANMQRQGIPLLEADSPIVGTGIEYTAAKYSGSVLLSETDGVVEYADANKIIIKTAKDKETYYLANYLKSNDKTTINQRPLVKKGDKVKKDQIIADGPSTDKGELALGKNLVTAIMPFDGFNFEDAIILSEKLVKDDVFTSVHMRDFEIDCRDTKLGPEEITRDIPNVSEEARKNLDINGIVKIGTEVKEGDILVGKVTPKGVQELSSEERLLHAIFGEKTREVRDTSLRVDNGAAGIIHDIKVFTKENTEGLPTGVLTVVRVYIAQKRKIQVGDKMAGRHGNKGVVSLILPEEDLPYMEDGTPVDMILNPQGIPSRMNLGQVLELHLGMAGLKQGIKYATPSLAGATVEEVKEEMKKAGMAEDGKVTLFDGRSGKKFDNRVAVGVMYMLKLDHMIEDKMHGRSTGPYSLVTQQPLGGKAQFGGQRFGEMEVWALYAYGAANILQELITIKSDDIVGRVKVYESLVKGKPVTGAGVPESFRVLIKEFQAIGLDVQITDTDDKVHDLKDLEEQDLQIDEPIKIKEVEVEPKKGDE